MMIDFSLKQVEMKRKLMRQRGIIKIIENFQKTTSWKLFKFQEIVTNFYSSCKNDEKIKNT